MTRTEIFIDLALALALIVVCIVAGLWFGVDTTWVYFGISVVLALTRLAGIVGAAREAADWRKRLWLMTLYSAAVTVAGTLIVTGVLDLAIAGPTSIA